MSESGQSGSRRATGSSGGGWGKRMNFGVAIQLRHANIFTVYMQ